MVSRLWPSVFAWIAISVGDCTRNSACSGKLTMAGNSWIRVSVTPIASMASRLYSAMRRPFTEPAARCGISLHDPLDVGAHVRGRYLLDHLRLGHCLSFYFLSGGNAATSFGPMFFSKLRMLSLSASGPVNTGW